MTRAAENGEADACWDKHGLVNMCGWQFVLKAVILVLVVISIIIGNSLVIAAVSVYKKLRKSIRNWFIVSLALADFTLGVVILPFSLCNEIFGYWLFSETLCQIWLVTDVWICTSSILHLCAISFDRYIAIVYPLRYPTLMTHRRCRIICLAMWTLSFGICFPGLVKWEPAAQSLNSTWTNGTEEAGPDQCEVHSNSMGYIIYSALGSFFIPSIVMTAFYIKIFLVARKFLRQSRTGIMAKSPSSQAMRVHRGISTKLSLYNNAKTVYEMSDLISSTGESQSDPNGENGCYQNDCAIDSVSQHNADSVINQSPTHNQRRASQKSARSEATLFHSLKRSKTRNSAPNVMNKETKAAKTLAIIVGGFIVCWTPFFVCYLLEGAAGVDVNVTMFSIFVWIGYINSLINPCIYACFSNDYRHAFKQILKCKLHRDRNRKGVWRYFGSLYVSSSADRQSSFTTKPQQLTKPLS